jgi:hypothetical protein
VLQHPELRREMEISRTRAAQRLRGYPAPVTEWERVSTTLMMAESIVDDLRDRHIITNIRARRMYAELRPMENWVLLNRPGIVEDEEKKKEVAIALLNDDLARAFGQHIRVLDFE